MALRTRRDRKKELQWRRLMRRQVRSGLSVRAWCRQHGQRESAFYWWRSELARRDRVDRDSVGSRTSPPFLPVRVVGEAAPNSEGQIEIVLAGGRRVRVNGRVDRQTLADVVAVLETPGDWTTERHVGVVGEAQRC